MRVYFKRTVFGEWKPIHYSEFPKNTTFTTGVPFSGTYESPENTKEKAEYLCLEVPKSFIFDFSSYGDKEILNFLAFWSGFEHVAKRVNDADDIVSEFVKSVQDQTLVFLTKNGLKKWDKKQKGIAEILEAFSGKIEENLDQLAKFAESFEIKSDNHSETKTFSGHTSYTLSKCIDTIENFFNGLKQSIMVMEEIKIGINNDDFLLDYLRSIKFSMSFVEDAAPVNIKAISNLIYISEHKKDFKHYANSILEDMLALLYIAKEKQLTAN